MENSVEIRDREDNLQRVVDNGRKPENISRNVAMYGYPTKTNGQREEKEVYA